MAEPERRRRRLRRGSSASPAGDATAPPSDDPPARAGAPARRHPDRAGEEAPGSPGGDSVAAQTAPVHDPGAPAKPTPARGPFERETERGLRGLVGAGSSQLSRSAALRARDAARPSDAEVAAAEQELVVIRRNWVPRDTLPGP